MLFVLLPVSASLTLYRDRITGNSRGVPVGPPITHPTVIHHRADPSVTYAIHPFGFVWFFFSHVFEILLLESYAELKKNSCSLSDGEQTRGVTFAKSQDFGAAESDWGTRRYEHCKNT